MKKISTLLALVVMTVTFAQTTITHSTDMVTNEFVVGCGDQGGTSTSFNSYSRSFVLADFGITTGFEVTDVTFAIKQLTGDLPFFINLSTTDAPYPTGTLTSLSSTVEVYTAADSESIVTYTYSTPVLVPAGSELVCAIESDGEADLVNWRLGGNLGGETAPSYIEAPACGVNSPVTFDSVGFPGHLIMSITGNTTMGTVEVNSRNLAIYPNPATDQINVSLKNNADVVSYEIVNLAGQSVISAKSSVSSVNVSFLQTGVYILKVKDSEGVTHLSKFVKK